MQQVREGAAFTDGVVNQLFHVSQIALGFRTRDHQRIERDFRSGKVLAKTIVQLARNTPPLFILNGEQLRREPAESCRSLLNHRFQPVTSLEEGLLGEFPLPEMVADLILAATSHQGAANCADQRSRAQGSLEKSYISQRGARPDGNFSFVGTHSPARKHDNGEIRPLLLRLK